MMNTALVLGAVFMKVLFRILYIESSGAKSTKPIVYMAHPEDLYAGRSAPVRPGFQWADLLVSRTQGLRVRRALYVSDPKRVATLAQGVIEMLRSAPGVQFLTVPESIEKLARIS
jgi:hypothetical protein